MRAKSSNPFQRVNWNYPKEKSGAFLFWVLRQLYTYKKAYKKI
ncbi:hypothetical protein APA_814 [Pseudanabaena sp. lw0831]|nr:hypothetical protein APA_814 [Pseudanabaena sp. lw0831]